MLLFTGSVQGWEWFRKETYAGYAIRGLEIQRKTIPGDPAIGTVDEVELRVYGHPSKLPEKTVKRIKDKKLQQQRRIAAYHAKMVKGAVAGKW